MWSSNGGIFTLNIQVMSQMAGLKMEVPVIVKWRGLKLQGPL